MTAAGAILTMEQVCKSFRVASEPAHTVKEAAFRLFRGGGQQHRFDALSDIDLVVQRGEALALVGANGSGKSTLFKIMSGILRPTRGRVWCGGTISPLIELSAGFHPELTGIENVFLNGAVHGLSRAEVRNKLPAIREFADIGDFVHSPVRTYSSGMMARLAFALAINVDAEVLLIDEVLAVGDFRFHRKCLQRILALKSEGVTIIYVSHDLKTVRQLCDRAVWLQAGRLVADGTPEAIIQAYTGEP